jgi:hypothetical protein
MNDQAFTVVTASRDFIRPRLLSIKANIFFVTCVLVVALTLTEPATAGGLGFFARFVFIALGVFPTVCVAWMISGWVFNRASLKRTPPWLLLVFAGAAAGALMSPWSALLEFSFGVVDLTEPGALPLMFSAAQYRIELLDELLEVPLKTALIWPLMNGMVMWHMGKNSPNSAPAVNTATEFEPPAETVIEQPKIAPNPSIPSAPTSDINAESDSFFKRLPASLGRDIVFLQSEEHYLRIVTAWGEHLMLCGLTRAVEELERVGIAGAQVHRSYWVTWEHMCKVDQRPGELAVCLSDGRRIPLARRRVREVVRDWELHRAALQTKHQHSGV